MNRGLAVSEKGNILIVDDEPRFRRIVRMTLVEHGYTVWDVRRGFEALSLIRAQSFDVVLLDINLPGMTGIEVCREIRAKSSVVIVMLTASDLEADKIAAFDAGANDYLTKPFRTAELFARIRAQLRRKNAVTEASLESFQAEGILIDFAARTVTRQDQKVLLSPKQYQLLRYLVNEQGKVLTHRALLQTVWGPDYGEETMLLRSFIAQLRKLIEPDPSQPRYIVTIPWVGYRFDAHVQSDTKFSKRTRHALETEVPSF